MSSPFLDSVRRVIRTLHYSIRTEQSYVSRIRQYIMYHGKRHPEEMSAIEVGEFLSYLANKRRVAAATQNQAQTSERCRNCSGTRMCLPP